MITNPTYEDIPELMWRFRRECKLTQEELATEVNRIIENGGDYYSRGKTNRAAVNRIEKKRMVLEEEMADALDHLVVEKLNDGDVQKALEDLGFDKIQFRNLTMLRDLQSTERRKETGITELVSQPGLTDLYVVLCDMTNVAKQIIDGLLNSQPTEVTITLIVPTEERVRRLFEIPYGSDDLYKGYSERLNDHLKRQDKLFLRLASQWEGVTLKIFESNSVMNPIVTAKRHSGTSCVYWPCIPTRREQSDRLDRLSQFTVASSDMASWHERLIEMMIPPDGGNGSSTALQKQKEVSLERFHSNLLVVPEPKSSIAKSQDGVQVFGTIDYSNFCSRIRRPSSRQEKSAPDEHEEYLAVALMLLYKCEYRAGKKSISIIQEQKRLISGEGSGLDKKWSLPSARISPRVLGNVLKDIFSNLDAGEKECQMGKLKDFHSLLESSELKDILAKCGSDVRKLVAGYSHSHPDLLARDFGALCADMYAITSSDSSGSKSIGKDIMQYAIVLAMERAVMSELRVIYGLPEEAVELSPEPKKPFVAEFVNDPHWWVAKKRRREGDNLLEHEKDAMVCLVPWEIHPPYVDAIEKGIARLGHREAKWISLDDVMGYEASQASKTISDIEVEKFDDLFRNLLKLDRNHPVRKQLREYVRNYLGVHWPNNPEDQG